MFEVNNKIRLKHTPEKEYIVVGHLPNGLPIVRNNDFAFNISSDALSMYEKVPEKKTAWINIYNNWTGYLYSSKEEAVAQAFVGRKACIEISYYEGQGL